MEIIIFAPTLPNFWVSEFCRQYHRTNIAYRKKIELFVRFEKFLSAIANCDLPIMVLDELKDKNQLQQLLTQCENLQREYLLVFITKNFRESNDPQIIYCSDLDPLEKIREFLRTKRKEAERKIKKEQKKNEERIKKERQKMEEKFPQFEE